MAIFIASSKRSRVGPGGQDGFRKIGDRAEEVAF